MVCISYQKYIVMIFLIDMPIHHKNIRARPLLSLFKPDIGVLVFRVHLPTICLLSPLRCCFTLHIPSPSPPCHSSRKFVPYSRSQTTLKRTFACFICI